MYDLGDTYPATIEVRDAAGTLINAASVTFVFTLPDGTSTAPIVPANPSSGRYTHDLIVSQHGLHRFRAVATGPAVAFTDAFNAASPDWPAFVGLAEVKKHLNIPAATTTHDEELRGFILSASAVVEDITGAIARRTVVETMSGRGDRALLLVHRPVMSITSVVESGSTVDPSGYTVTSAGVLSRVGRWAAGVDNITITYVVGRAATPPAVIDGTKELIRINWRPQAGGNHSVFDQGRGDQFAVAVAAGEPRLGFFVPNTVMQRLQPSGRGPHVA